MSTNDATTYPAFGYCNPVEDKRRVDFLAGLFELEVEAPAPTATVEPATGEVNISREFVWAGKAIFTVSNPEGEHYTYRVGRKDPDPSSKYTNAVWFVALLTGPDNDRDYTYMGMLSWPGVPPGTKVTQVPFCKLTRASKLGAESRPVAVFNWAMRAVYGGSIVKPGYSILHDGKCARCGRHLTDPESLRTGLGPVCREMGV